MLFVEGDLIDNKYTVIEKIGQGGFGVVLKVEDKDGTVCALKYCSSEEEEYILRFKREVRITKKINHKNVIDILDYNLNHSPSYFIMPLAKSNLTELIPEIKNDFSNILDIFEKVSKGVQAIHRYDTTHRDIKPDNVLIMKDGTIVISDLGLAKLNNRDSTILTRASIMMGTDAYTPPEAFTYGGTRDLNASGDIYMLGKTLYEMLTSRIPLIMDRSAVEPGLWFIIEKATKYDMNQRYQTIDDILDSLNQFRNINDPTINKNLMFENLNSVAKERLKEKNEYLTENISKMLSILTTFEDSETFLNYFHEIPFRLIQVLAYKEFNDLLEQVMLKYYNSIKDIVGIYSFNFAEDVAIRMEVLFSGTTSLKVKKYCVLSVLIASVRLNRFSAMGSFDNLLIKIEDDEVAYEVGSGLQDEIYYYKSLYERIPKEKLHLVLQPIWEQCNI